MQEELSKLRQDISSQTKQTLSQQQALQQQMEAEKRLLEERAQRAEEDGLYRSSQLSAQLSALSASKLADVVEGYMQKKGHMRQDWKRRYIVWTPRDRSLVYYTDNTKKNKRGGWCDSW